jgi:hypothetical protein
MNRIFHGINALLDVIKFKNLPKENRQITFYNEGESYWPHIKGLLIATLARNNKSVCYVSSSLDDPGFKMSSPNLNKFFIGNGFIRNYFFQNLDTDVMVMTMPDLHNFQIKRSHHNVHYIYVQHSLVSLHTIYRHKAFDHYDTICAAGPHHVSEIRAIEERYSLPEKNIINLGYSLLDNLISNKNKNYNLSFKKNKILKKILIAPSWGDQGMIESGLCKNLINQLLELGHEVILRPHPQTLKFAKERIADIKNQYKKNLGFIFEDGVIDHTSLYESDIMVSDWSGVAIEYAFAFNKPVIFCDIPRKINNPNFMDIKIEPIEVSIRENIGVIWDCKSSIKDIIELCLQKIKVKESDLSLMRNQHCFNLGVSDEVFARILEEKICINK